MIALCYNYIGKYMTEHENTQRLINLESPAIKPVLNILLQDKTTKQNIIWATDAYADHGPEFSDKSHIKPSAFNGYMPIELQPRIEKALDEQQARTRKKAEVFTPVWVCNYMNNVCDEEWFGRKNVFNTENEVDHTWAVTKEKITFPAKKNWMQYVDSRRLEITCGEAPYLVSRYDAATGNLILPPKRRIGILDRKLRIVDENTTSEEEWLKWAARAYQASYGYEYQGDNLLIARINLMMTFDDYYRERWNKDPSITDLKKIANIIAWNVWQMDGLTDTVPLGKPGKINEQLSLFDLDDSHKEEPAPFCKIRDWRADKTVMFASLKER